MSAGSVITRDTRLALPAFADSSRLRLLLGTLLYLAQGFPQGIFFYAMPTWLAANGESTEVVAMAAAAASLPWSLKFIAGLVMDRYTWLDMGRRRPWSSGSSSHCPCSRQCRTWLSTRWSWTSRPRTRWGA
jgi:MFS family permease